MLASRFYLLRVHGKFPPCLFYRTGPQNCSSIGGGALALFTQSHHGESHRGVIWALVRGLGSAPHDKIVPMPGRSKHGPMFTSGGLVRLVSFDSSCVNINIRSILQPILIAYRIMFSADHDVN
jgi:hypothetical protein